MEFSDELRKLEKKYKKELEKLDKQITETLLRNHLTELEVNYEDCPEIINYLKDVEADIIENIHNYLPKEEQESADAFQALTQQRQKHWNVKSKVNVMV